MRTIKREKLAGFQIAQLEYRVRWMWQSTLLIAALQTGLAITYAFSASTTGLWYLVDAFVLAGLAWQIKRRSRIAALALLSYWVAARLLFAPATPAPALHLGITVAIGVVLIRGSYALFRLEHDRLSP